jgi:SNF2 family DNA or RNA helicase
LFRGKPGFVVYRHLKCALFSESITLKDHVGGWRRLTLEDQQALQERIETSLVLLEKEDQDLHADELVETKFQGQMRTKPPGLVGTLLPFQQEGVSWMYHQERHLPELRGGILADEMGMVRLYSTVTTLVG